MQRGKMDAMLKLIVRYFLSITDLFVCLNDTVSAENIDFHVCCSFCDKPAIIGLRLLSTCSRPLSHMYIIMIIGLLSMLKRARPIQFMYRSSIY